MKINKLLTNSDKELLGAFSISHDIYKDERGYFYESWNKSKFDELAQISRG